MRKFLAVEGPLRRSRVLGVGVLRLRESARVEQTHYAQDDMGPIECRLRI